MTAGEVGISFLWSWWPGLMPLCPGRTFTLSLVEHGPPKGQQARLVSGGQLVPKGE